MNDKKGGLKAFDHVFWSCDGYQKRHDGYLEPAGENSDYADQVMINANMLKLYFLKLKVFNLRSSLKKIDCKSF